MLFSTSCQVKLLPGVCKIKSIFTCAGIRAEFEVVWLSKAADLTWDFDHHDIREAPDKKMPGLFGHCPNGGGVSTLAQMVWGTYF